MFLTDDGAAAVVYLQLMRKEAVEDAYEERRVDHRPSSFVVSSSLTLVKRFCPRLILRVPLDRPPLSALHSECLSVCLPLYNLDVKTSCSDLPLSPSLATFLCKHLYLRSVYVCIESVSAVSAVSPCEVLRR